MKNYKEFFKDKKITVMGLGLLGRGLGYTKFLAECGANITVTDLKTKEQLASSLKHLLKYKKITYRLGEHSLEDFRNRDMIIKSAGVPMDSIYIKEAQSHNIRVEMDVSLFMKFAEGVKVIGVTGTRGKSMTTMLIYHVLKENTKDRNVFLGGNVRGVATLPLLTKAKPRDLLVAELDSWQLQGFGDSQISPNVAVFTSFMSDHMNYYKGDMEAYFGDKANIFKYQKQGDTLVIGEAMKKLINKKDDQSDFVIAKAKDVENYKFLPPGEHNRVNLACAVEVVKALGIAESKIKKSVATFKGVEGRLQLLRTYKGIKIYNDNNATTPESTIAGLKAVAATKSKKVILICGGATKKVDLKNFVKAVNAYPKSLYLIPGTGTDELLINKIKTTFYKGKDFKDTVMSAVKSAKKGDIVLFSPAFASFGLFQNEYERNDLFVKIVKGLK